MSNELEKESAALRAATYGAALSVLGPNRRRAAASIADVVVANHDQVRRACLEITQVDVQALGVDAAIEELVARARRLAEIAMVGSTTMARDILVALRTPEKSH